MSASIDTHIPHHFLTADKGQFFLAVVVLGSVLGLSISIHFMDIIDMEGSRRGRRAYYWSFFLIPALIALIPTMILQYRRSGTYAISVDSVGISDNRIAPMTIKWRDIESIHFKSRHTFGKSVGQCKITLRNDCQVRLQAPFNSFLGRLLVWGQIKASPIIINSHGIKSGFRKLKEVITAFATLHPHIQIVGRPFGGEEQT